ncbi:uncharacterized protein LOC127287892 isoform X2 [Leptopilina boulardi]|uniref:uncharacterized protein LOC127287892 isoform X2 n=1 Tax=Leptopilina boulardi TaxID=63433 RepID=UPI0021F59DAE|nr:uncharacterized protein LOC127287892 isoform X2 [Leptopilina boulardi]
MNLFIPKRNRCCSEHIIKKRFYEEEFSNMLVVSTESEIDVDEFKKFINQLSNKVDARFHHKIGEYAISEERLKVLTGHTWDDVSVLQNMLKGHMRTSSNRNIMQAIVIFLFKLRSGNSDALIAVILDIQEEIVRDSIHSALKCFREHVLPKYFGVDAKTREFYLSQTVEVVKMLHDLDDDLLVCICDGTYLRHQKSSNNIYQRLSYSGQKNVRCVSRLQSVLQMVL